MNATTTPGRFSGERLRAARTAAGLRPERLALVIERSVWSIHEYEGGRVTPPLDVALAMADALGVSVYDLLTEQTAAEKARVRAAVSRVKQGLPPTVEDPAVLSQLATLLAQQAERGLTDGTGAPTDRRGLAVDRGA